MATGAAGRAMSATTRLRRGSTGAAGRRRRERRCPLGAGGDPDRVAGRAHRDRPGERPAQRDLGHDLVVLRVDPPQGARDGHRRPDGARPDGHGGRAGAGRDRDPGRDRVGGRVDAGDLVAAGHPETTGARDHPVGEAAGRDGGHHRRGTRRRDRSGRGGRRRRPGRREVRGRSATTRPVAASPATTTSARIAATHRRLGAVRRRPPAMAGAAGTVTSAARAPVPLGQLRWRPGAPWDHPQRRSGSPERPAAAARADHPPVPRCGPVGRVCPARWPSDPCCGSRPRRRGRWLGWSPSSEGSWEVMGVGGHGPRGSRGGAARRRLAGLVARPCGSPSRAGQASSSSWRRIRDTASPSPTVRITESSRSSPAILRA